MKKEEFKAKIKNLWTKFVHYIKPPKSAMAKYQVEKVPFIKTLSVFKGIKLPWILIIVTLALQVAQAILTLNTVTFSATIIDSVGNVASDEFAQYIIMSVIMGVCAVGAGITGAYFVQKINQDMRCKLWKKILKLRQREMGVDGGEQLISRVTLDCDTASNYFTLAISVIVSATKLITYIIAMFNANVTMSGFAMILIPVSGAICILLSYLKYRVALKRQGFLALSTAYLAERTKDLQLIKTCNSQDKETEKGNKFFDALYDNSIKSGWITLLGNILNKFLEMATTILPFAVGAVLYANGDITIGVVVMFNSLIGECKNVLQQMISYVSSFKETNGSTARITKVFSHGEEPLDDGVTAPDEVRDIKFENVTFAYTDKDVLKDVTLTIPKNKVTAVLGKNGSGKTTSFKLIERLYDVNDGAIKFGDDDIHDYSLSSWRKKLCIVAQGGELMSGTLKSNICYGRDDVTDEEYNEALKKSHVADFVPEGTDPIVLPDGSNFSGGQRQCIALARAMLSNKPYLLLDEATCNLDAKREHDIMDALENVIKDRTTLIIAHSLSTIQNADYVIVLNNGVVESVGTPQDIAKQTDNYLAKMMSRAAKNETIAAQEETTEKTPAAKKETKKRTKKPAPAAT